MRGDSSPAAARFDVYGEVQGVGFRWFVQQQARNLGLRGWVRNRDDGSVEVAATGDAAALDALELALRHGPPHARVREVRRSRLPAGARLPLPFAIAP